MDVETGPANRSTIWNDYVSNFQANSDRLIHHSRPQGSRQRDYNTLLQDSVG
jgi:hypothetical protein